MQKPTVIFKREEHRNQVVLSLYMPKDPLLNGVAKALHAKWSATKKAWYVPFDKHAVNSAFTAYKEHAWVDYSALKTSNRHVERSETKSKHLSGSSHSAGSLREASAGTKKHKWTETQNDALREFTNKLRRRRYSDHTYNTYSSLFKSFLAAHPEKTPEEITEQEIKTYLVNTVNANGYSISTQNQIINSIKPVGFLA